MSRNTLENLAAKWIAEINHYASSAPKILVGTKLDLYDELRRKKVKIVSNGDRPVKQKEIDSLMRGNTFLDYVPCSSISQSNLAKMFEKAITVALQHKGYVKPAKRTVWSRIRERYFSSMG